MARSVKKVKRAKSKKFWIILSSIIGVVIVGSIVGFLIWYCEYNTADLTNLFSEYTDSKINYDELETILSNSKGDYEHNKMFVFVYNSSYTYDEPDDKTSTDYTSYLEYKEALSQLDELKSLVDKINDKKATSYDENNNKVVETDEKKYEIGFYVINASISTNNDAEDNDDYDNLSSPALLTFASGKINDTNTYDSLTYISSSTVVSDTNKNTYSSLSGGSSSSKLTYTIKNVVEYLNNVYSSVLSD